MATAVSAIPSIGSIGLSRKVVGQTPFLALTAGNGVVSPQPPVLSVPGCRNIFLCIRPPRGGGACGQAMADANWSTLERYGGLNPALRKIAQLAQESPVSNGRGMIDDFHLWGSRRCRRKGGPQEWPTFSPPATGLSERAEPSPLWSVAYPKRRTGRGTARISRVRCGKARRDCPSRVPRRRGALEGCWWWERPRPFGR